MSSLQTPSPLKQTKTETTTPASSINPHTQPPASSNEQSAKRRKLTQQEKDEQVKEKEAKVRARAEKKAQKEAEDRLKADQKAQRDEEKRKKNEEKEEKKRARELKQQQEEEEKKKKERSQMRLNAFFSKPKGGAEPTGNTMVEPVQIPYTGQISLSTDTVETVANAAPPSPQKAIVQNAQSDYERVFLPFSLPPTGILAPLNAFHTTPENLAAAQARLDNIVTNKDVDMEPITVETLRSVFPKRRRGLQTETMAEIVERINGSADNPIDLTEDPSARPLDLLKPVSMKYLHFGEDVRPPYYGTYTKRHDPGQERKVARNPTIRGLADLNYDYDSEAEWEEPGEGEDLDSEGEDDLEEDGEEDLDGFLDDEDDPEVKRRLLNGDQEPVSTGLCWEDTSGVSRLNDGSGAISTEFKEFKLGFLLQTQAPIDPFSDSYWTPEIPVARASMAAVIKGEQPIRSMNPPRLPLGTRPVNGLINTLNGPQKASPAFDTKTGKPKRMIDANLLPAFKAEVAGSDLTKIGMIEALKKKFPKVPKDAITNTLTDVAQRIGPSAAEKRWVLFS
ncbi:chromatin assembly factor-I (CAF-I) p90 subunit [Didymosphaeria variabile]|uniref:Chromatin assembly factor-I (CAF-I) p90 subunit n=1 Tax=Didymosphaeria variabile TaxID=1932322 RepID=A0A9W9C5Q7_9PLEO|nr:chromatin assembly factor-I (CAF-I) p90 subunit [Didymosphaeria variabile]KAJ4346745.1 chromatin assembly factor-I (CAF-I) p90 subunit [Didymosphaeria variabile]